MNSFDEEFHEYTSDGVKLPSVTEICDCIGGADRAKLPEQILRYAADRGTRVHEYCSLICLGIDIEEIDGDCADYVSAFLEWFNTYKPKVLYSELQMFMKNLGFAGTCDLVCEINNEIYLIDFKTPASVDKVSLSAQLAGYDIGLLNKSIIAKKYFYLQLKPNAYIFKECLPDFKLWDCCKYIYEKKNKKEKIENE